MYTSPIWLFSVGKIDFGNTRLNFWDLGGQEDLQALWDKVGGVIQQYVNESLHSTV